MKITKIECIPCSIPKPMQGNKVSKIVLVKLHTDEGIIGVADGGSLESWGQDVAMLLIKSWEPILIGANPFDKEMILSKLQGFIYQVKRVTFPAAVATIDFALWDLVGKALNQPVYQLLGGKACEKLGINFMLTGEAGPLPEQRAEEALRVLATGVRNITMKAGPNWGNPTIEADVANVRAVRKAIGDRDDVNLGVDVNGGYNYTSALDLCLRLEEFNLFKVEQPVPFWDVDGLARLRKNIHTRICAHEASTKIPGLMEVIKKDAADIVGTKLAWTGGISEAVKWGAIAKAANMGMFCGGMNGPIECAAQAHWLASDAWYGLLAHANFAPILHHNTFDTSNPPIHDALTVKPMVCKGGYAYPPDGPGFGLELNEKVIHKYITKGKNPITIGK